VYQSSIKGWVLFHRLNVNQGTLLYRYLNRVYFVQDNSSLIQSKVQNAICIWRQYKL